MGGIPLLLNRLAVVLSFLGHFAHALVSNLNKFFFLIIYELLTLIFKLNCNLIRILKTHVVHFEPAELDLYSIVVYLFKLVGNHHII